MKKLFLILFLVINVPQISLADSIKIYRCDLKITNTEKDKINYQNTFVQTSNSSTSTGPVPGELTSFIIEESPPSDTGIVLAYNINHQENKGSNTGKMKISLIRRTVENRKISKPLISSSGVKFTYNDNSGIKYDETIGELSVIGNQEKTLTNGKYETELSCAIREKF